MSLAARVDALATRISTEVKGKAPKTLGGVAVTQVYVTADWATDPNNPANGGTLPAGVPVLET